MPVILKKNIDTDTTIGIWYIREEEPFFLERLELSSSEAATFEGIKGMRRVHWLCSRYLLHLMTKEDQRRDCLKDQFGKPYLDGSDQFISFSHSEDLVAVAVSDVPVGIDIQLGVEKITRISHKFVNSAEMSFANRNLLKNLHLIWGAKEAVFKAYGRKEVDFRKHMTFRETENQRFQVLMKKPDEGPFLYSGSHEQWGDYYLVYLKQVSDHV